MSSFLFSTMLGFALFHLLRLSQSRRVRQIQVLRLGGVGTLAIKHRTYQFLQVCFIVVALSAILLRVVKALHRDDGFVFGYLDVLTGPAAANSAFGAALGWVAASLSSHIVSQPAEYAFTPKDRLQIGAIAFLVILGIGGEDVIRSLGSRVNKLAFAGAEVSLADAPVKAAPSNIDRYSQLKAGENGVDPKNNGSQGLSLVARLPEMIGDDFEYVSLLSGSDKTGLEGFRDRLDRQRQMLVHSIVPIAGCLRSLYQNSADANALNDRVSALIRPVKALISSHADGDLAFDTAFGELGAQANAVAVEAYQNPPLLSGATAAKDLDATTPVIEGCRPLVAELCAEDANVLSAADLALWTKGKRDEALACLRGRLTASFELGQGGKGAFFERDRRRLREAFALMAPKTGANDVLVGTWARDMLDLPYMAIVYAELSAQLQHYESAFFSLDAYLDQPRFEDSLEGFERRPPTPIARKWFEIRTRFMLSSVLQEWVDLLGDRIPASVRHYHEDNLDTLIAIYEGQDPIQRIIKASGGKIEEGRDPLLGSWTDIGDCESSTFPRKLVETYLGAMLAYVDNGLDDPDLRRSRSGVIYGRAEFVRTRNLRCINQESRNLLKAEALFQWARAQVNNVELARDVKGLDWVKDHLAMALDAVEVARSTLYRDNEEDTKAQDRHDVLGAIHGTETMSMYRRIRHERTVILGLQQ